MTMLLRWKLDEAADNSLIEEPFYPLILPAAAGSVAGRIGRARSFDGVGQYATTFQDFASELPRAIATAKASWTLSFWLKRSEDFADERVILALRAGADEASPSQWRLLQVTMFGPSLYLSFSQGDGNIGAYSPTMFIEADDEWHHYAIRKGPSTDGHTRLDFFRDGMLFGTWTDVTYISGDGGEDAVWWMAGLDGDMCFPGAIDDVRFYDESLDVQTVADLFRTTPLVEDLEDALIAAVRAVTGYAEDRVVLADRNTQAPPRDFISIRLGDVIVRGMDETTWHYQESRGPLGDIEARSSGMREVTVSIQAFTDHTSGSTSARAIMQRVQGMFMLDTTRDDLRRGGFQVANVGPVRTLNDVVESDIRGRALLEVTGRVRATVGEFLGYIAAVDVTDVGTEPNRTLHATAT